MACITMCRSLWVFVFVLFFSLPALRRPPSSKLPSDSSLQYTNLLKPREVPSRVAAPIDNIQPVCLMNRRVSCNAQRKVPLITPWWSVNRPSWTPIAAVIGWGGGGVVRVNLHTPVEVAPTGSIMVGHKRKSNTPRSHPGTFGHEKPIGFGTFYAKIHREKKKWGVSGVL